MTQATAIFKYSSLIVTVALHINPLSRRRRSFQQNTNDAVEPIDWGMVAKQLPSSTLTSRWDAGKGLSWR